MNITKKYSLLNSIVFAVNEKPSFKSFVHKQNTSLPFADRDLTYGFQIFSFGVNYPELRKIVFDFVFPDLTHNYISDLSLIKVPYYTVIHRVRGFQKLGQLGLEGSPNSMKKDMIFCLIRDSL